MAESDGGMVPLVIVALRLREGFLYLVRSLKDELEGGKLNMVSGHVNKFETVHEAGVRELHEESGIVAKPEELVHLARFSAKVMHTDGHCAENAMLDLFFINRRDTTVADIELSEEHVGKRAISIRAMKRFALSESLRESRRKPLALFTTPDATIIRKYTGCLEDAENHLSSMKISGHNRSRTPKRMTAV